MGEADRRHQSGRRRPGALEALRSGGVRAASADALNLARKGGGQFVIFVDDVDAVRAELDQARVTTISGPADRDWGMRTLTLADPGGSTWEITQELPSAASSP